jgi:predicted DNA binding CopG/RHH family protein
MESGLAGYSAAMSRSVSGEHVNGESFEGLLERLTRRLDSAGTHADLDVGFGADFDAQTDFARASFPGTGSYASPVARRRTLAPVAEAKTLKVRSGKPGADSMPLSYEMALRLHARRRSPGDGLAAKQAAQGNTKADLRKPAPGAPRTSPLDLPRQGAGPVSRLDAKPGAKPDLKSDSKPGAQCGPKLAPTLVQAGRDGRGKRRGEVRAGANTGSTAGVKTSSTAGMTAGIRTGSRGSSALQASTGTPGRVSERPRPIEIQGGKQRKSSAAAGARLRAKKQPMENRQSSKNTRSLENRHSFENIAPARELQLEVAQRAMALERRQSIVSIRLTDSEIERLRQRAAESGISVSGYMRSCVLDAEHLRAQVKQALAEMRRPIPGSMRPQQEAQLPNRLPALSSESGSGQAAAWSRMLWKSATFFLGLWFPLRHRV